MELRDSSLDLAETESEEVCQNPLWGHRGSHGVLMKGKHNVTDQKWGQDT